MAVISSTIITALYGVLGVFLIIELGLTGYVVDVSNGGWDEPNFLLFCSIWSLLVLGYLVSSMMFFSHPYGNITQLAVLVVTAIFWFAGSIALAALFRGSYSGFRFVQVAEAATAFGFFIWLIFTALAVIKGLASRGAVADGSAGSTTTAKPAGQPYVGA